MEAVNNHIKEAADNNPKTKSRESGVPKWYCHERI
jgi:hypothetical protein